MIFDEGSVRGAGRRQRSCAGPDRRRTSAKIIAMPWPVSARLRPARIILDGRRAARISQTCQEGDDGAGVATLNALTPEAYHAAGRAGRSPARGCGRLSDQHAAARAGERRRLALLAHWTTETLTTIVSAKAKDAGHAAARCSWHAQRGHPADQRGLGACSLAMTDEDVDASSTRWPGPLRE